MAGAGTKCRDYVDYIKRQPCIVTGMDKIECRDATFMLHAHHVTLHANRGISQKPSDFRCIPLRNDVHLALHNHGEKKFWRNRGIDPFEHIIKFQCMYFARLMFERNGGHEDAVLLERIIEEVQDGTSK